MLIPKASHHFWCAAYFPLTKTQVSDPSEFVRLPDVYIIAKTVLTIVGEDILDDAGRSQLSVGQPSDTAAAVHAVWLAFQQDDAEAILLVDGSNAFNALNRYCTLHNIQRV